MISNRHANKYHLYVAVRPPPTRTSQLTLDKHNMLVQASAVQTVERLLGQSKFLKSTRFRVCVSSTESEKPTEGLRRHGAMVMVYSGLGSEQYNVDTGWISRETDVVFNVPLPELVIVCMKYGAQSTAEALAASPMAKNARIIVWCKDEATAAAYNNFILPIINMVSSER